jgi:hypothetical protein
LSLAENVAPGRGFVRCSAVAVENLQKIAEKFPINIDCSIDRSTEVGSSQDSASEEAAILRETDMNVLQRVLRMESPKAP